MRRLLTLLKKDAILGVKDVFVLLEICFAVVMVVILLFLIPEDVRTEGKAYIYDSTGVVRDFVNSKIDDPGQEMGEYFVDSRDELIAGMTEDKSAIGLIITRDEGGPYGVELLTQPYTPPALVTYVGVDMEDLLSMIAPPHGVYPADVYEHVEVTALRFGTRDDLPFNQRLLPPVLFYMVGIVGLFAMVSLICQEKVDQTIRAYRLSPGGLWLFLLSKHLIIVATGVITFSIIYLPMMGVAGYLECLLILLFTMVFGSTIGVFLGAVYESPMAAFGWVIVLMFTLSLPAISLFNPMFAPDWLRLIPSHYSLFALDAAMFPDDNAHLVWQGVGVLAGLSAALYLASAAFFSARVRREA